MSVVTARADGVLTITLDRPEKRNAVSIRMWEQLETAVRDLEPADEVLVLRGAAGTFSSGSDVREFLDPACDIRAGIASTHRAIAALHDVGIGSIAVVEGIAAGSALSLALSCDVVLAGPQASFCAIFARRGLAVDSGTSWLLPRLVGERRARELVLLGEPVDAATALQWGLITAVAPTPELASLVADYVSRMRAIPSVTHRANKALLAATWDRTLRQALDAEMAAQLEVLGADQTREAIAAFTDRRKETGT